MEQRHFGSGVHDFCFTRDAVKITNKALNYFIVSKAPDWDVVAFRTDDKVLCRLKRDEFYRMQKFNPQFQPRKAFTLIGEDQIGPVKTLVYRSPFHDDWIAQFKDVPKEVEFLICAYHKSKRMDGIVLRQVKQASSVGKKSVLKSIYVDEDQAGVRLSTQNLRSRPYKASDFSIPSGYRNVASLDTVRTSIDRRNEADSIFSQLGLGEKLGSGK